MPLSLSVTSFVFFCTSTCPTCCLAGPREPPRGLRGSADGPGIQQCREASERLSPAGVGQRQRPDSVICLGRRLDVHDHRNCPVETLSCSVDPDLHRVKIIERCFVEACSLQRDIETSKHGSTGSQVSVVTRRSGLRGDCVIGEAVRTMLRRRYPPDGRDDEAV